MATTPPVEVSFCTSVLVLSRQMSVSCQSRSIIMRALTG